ncbi:hypothetical protein ACKWTF_002563 [Chironomus riparius]
MHHFNLLDDFVEFLTERKGRIFANEEKYPQKRYFFYNIFQYLKVDKSEYEIATFSHSLLFIRCMHTQFSHIVSVLALSFVMLDELKEIGNDIEKIYFPYSNKLIVQKH